jgi:CRP-like cAMP-binding protein
MRERDVESTADSHLTKRLRAAFGDEGPLTQALADAAVVSSHAAGDLLREAGLASDCAILVLDGGVRDMSDPAGRLGPGALIDLADALSGSVAMSALVASEDCVVARIPAHELLAAARGGGPAAVSLVRILAKSARASATADLGMREENRIIAEILRRARPSDADAGWLIDPMPRHRELAADLAVTEERVAGAIARLMRDGLARRRVTALEITDRAGARKLIGAAV